MSTYKFSVGSLGVDMSKAREIKRHTDGREIFEQHSHRWVDANDKHGTESIWLGLVWECVDCGYLCAVGVVGLIPNCATYKAQRTNQLS